MNLKTYFSALADYHAWATRKLLDDYLAPLTDEEWKRDCGLFFRSIHGTVNHLLVTDHAWYARFADNHSPRTPLNAELHADRAELCAALHASVTRWRAWLTTLAPARFDGELAYTRQNGEAMRVPFTPTLGHVFNHATHHRGQISAVVTAMGHPCPELDWMYQIYQETKRHD
jgi:uncharacterized damage-inducible protein DinB